MSYFVLVKKKNSNQLEVKFIQDEPEIVKEKQEVRSLVDWERLKRGIGYDSWGHRSARPEYTTVLVIILKYKYSIQGLSLTPPSIQMQCATDYIQYSNLNFKCQSALHILQAFGGLNIYCRIGEGSLN